MAYYTYRPMYRLDINWRHNALKTDLIDHKNIKTTSTNDDFSHTIYGMCRTRAGPGPGIDIQ